MHVFIGYADALDLSLSFGEQMAMDKIKHSKQVREIEKKENSDAPPFPQLLCPFAGRGRIFVEGFGGFLALS